MPRNPFGGFISGVFGLAWAAIGVALAAWAGTAALEPQRGVELAAWAMTQSPLALPWSPQEAALWAVDNVVPFAIAAAVALALAASNLRTARIALRPANQSADGKGEVQLSAREDPRVGKALEGAILLREPPTPGDEFDVVLTGHKPGMAPYRIEQKVRARQGVHGVSLPFRFDVPATAPAGFGSRWLLEFGRAGKRRSAVDLKLGAAPEHEVRLASAATVAGSPAVATPATAKARGYADQVERLLGVFGGKLDDAQRQQLRAKLAAADGHAAARSLDGLRKLTPHHMKLVKYAVIGLIVVFFVMPFVFGVLGLVLAALFGS